MTNNLENTLKMEINTKEHNAVLKFLQHLKNDKLNYDAINAAAIEFHIHCSTISKKKKYIKKRMMIT